MHLHKSIELLNKILQNVRYYQRTYYQIVRKLLIIVTMLKIKWKYEGRVMFAMKLLLINLCHAMKNIWTGIFLKFIGSFITTMNFFIITYTYLLCHFLIFSVKTKVYEYKNKSYKNLILHKFQLSKYTWPIRSLNCSSQIFGVRCIINLNPHI